MVHHTWSYQALVHDLLKMNLNKVQVEVYGTLDYLFTAIQVHESDDTSASQSKKDIKVFDLDTTLDSFWAANMDTPFPKIAGFKVHLNGV
jgi:hypothetical protein